MCSKLIKDINKLHYDFFEQKGSSHKNQHLSQSCGIEFVVTMQIFTKYVHCLAQLPVTQLVDV